MKKLIPLLLLYLAIPAWPQAFVLDPVAGRPSHLMYTPLPNINSKGSLVLMLHEISYSLDGRLALQLSLVESIGHVDFGVRYQLGSNTTVGGGLSDWLGFSHGPPRGHFYYSRQDRYYYNRYRGKRLGAYLNGALTSSSKSASTYTLHTQLGSIISLGLDIGFINQTAKMWSLMLELGSSLNIEAGQDLDRDDGTMVITGTGGIRIVPPPVPYLFIDVGLTPLSFIIGNDNGFVIGSAGIYLDVGVALDLD